MTFPSTPIISTFSVDEAPLNEGGTWGGNIFGSGNVCQALGGVAAANGNFSNSHLLSPMGPDLQLYFDVVDATSSLGLTWRLSNLGSSVTGYEAFIIPDVANTVQVFRIDSEASEVKLGADISVTFSAGDGFGISHIGSTITVYKRTSGVWAALDTRTDSTYTAAGLVGMGIDGASQLDNYGGGTLASGGGLIVNPISGRGGVTAQPLVT